MPTAAPPFTFVHAADLHLDSPLRGLSRYDGAPLDALRNATRRALENLVRLCIDERARLLLIAGDVYDGDWKDYNTGLFFNRQLSRLERAGVRVVLVSGNHDAQSVVSRELRLGGGAVSLATDAPQTLVFDDLNVAVHGRGYGRQRETANLAADYPAALDGRFNIGLLHTALDGREGHDRYAPCRRDELIGKSYDYWALGHVHRREEVCREPWIVFPGNLQGRHARETGAKGASVVRVRDGRVAAVEHRALDVLRWARRDLIVDGVDYADDIVDLARDAIDAERAAADGRTLALRLRLSGACPAQRELMADPERWQNELRSAAGDCGGDVWLEKIVFATRPAADPAALAGDGGPLAALLGALRAARADDTELRALIDALTAQIRLPAEYRALPDALALDDPQTWRRLLSDAEQRLLSRLLGAATEHAGDGRR